MNTVDGYAMSSWESGYGDFVLARPGHACAGCPGTRAPRWCWPTCRLDGTPVAASPRQILQAQLDRLAERGWTAYAGTELEFIVFEDSYEQAGDKGYRGLTPANRYNVDYSVLGTSRIEPLLRHIRIGMAEAGMTVESAKGECNPGQHEIAFLYADVLDHLRPPRRLQDRGQGDRRARTAEPDVHGQGERQRRQLLPHPPVVPRRRRARRSWPATASTGCPRPASTSSPGQLAGLRELTLLLAPNVNSYKRYVPGSFAPTAVGWGIDNRTCALRLVGHGPSLRVECRVPGGDVNPYLAVAALIARGLHGVEQELPLSRPAPATPTPTTGRGCRPRCARRLELWEGSRRWPRTRSGPRWWRTTPTTPGSSWPPSTPR